MIFKIIGDFSGTILGNTLAMYDKGEYYELEFIETIPGKEAIFKSKILRIKREIKILGGVGEINYEFRIKDFDTTYIVHGFIGFSLEYLINNIIRIERLIHGLLIEFSELRCTKVYIESVYKLLKVKMRNIADIGPLPRIISNLEMAAKGKHIDPDVYRDLPITRTKSAR